MLNQRQLLIGEQRLPGELYAGDDKWPLVVFVHGSGSSRHSRRNVQVAETLQGHQLGTLLFDLLTPDEADDRSKVFDIPLLSRRVLQALDAIAEVVDHPPLGLFGASTGAAAALVAAAQRPDSVQAVVSRGGRPDLALDALPDVRAPTLMIVGGADTEVMELNRQAYLSLRCEKRIEIVPRATHLFQEAGALETVALLASQWFGQHLGQPSHP